MRVKVKDNLLSCSSLTCGNPTRLRIGRWPDVGLGPWNGRCLWLWINHDWINGRRLQKLRTCYSGSVLRTSCSGSEWKKNREEGSWVEWTSWWPGKNYRTKLLRKYRKSCAKESNGDIKITYQVRLCNLLERWMYNEDHPHVVYNCTTTSQRNSVSKTLTQNLLNTIVINRCKKI